MASAISGSDVAACAGLAPSLPYEEPNLQVLLTLAAFLLLLNVLHTLLDTLLHVGLLAQLILGALLGSPLANIIPLSVEKAVQSLGYIGLVLLVVEGGMSTRLDILSSPKSFILAVLTGCTGIVLPIGLSMILLPFAFHFTYLESFSVGASLSSTSLGTTFPVISSAGRAREATLREKDTSMSRFDHGLVNTRIGTILIGAALLDDIVGLILSSVIATLGHNLPSRNGLSPWSIARPIVTSAALLIVTVLLCRIAVRPLISVIGNRLERVSDTPLAMQSLALSAALTLWIAVLLAFVSIAYVIGSTVLLGAFCAGAFTTYAYDRLVKTTGKQISLLNPHRAFNAIRPVQEYILAPFFFASIGAAIPIKDLFRGETIWKGILFSGLMALAKVMACLPVLCTSVVSTQLITKIMGLSPRSLSSDPGNASIRRPWLPSLLLGFSLVARGEIGFLIINIARQAELVGCDAYNIGTWAIVLCTIIGPSVIGILVKNQGLLEEIESNPRWGIVNR